MKDVRTVGATLNATPRITRCGLDVSYLGHGSVRVTVHGTVQSDAAVMTLRLRRIRASTGGAVISGTWATLIDQPYETFESC